MKLGLCVRVKNEELILCEFIAHYIILGFDKITIYDNLSQPDVNQTINKLILKYNNIIEVIKDEIETNDKANWGQTCRYNHFLNNDKDLDWVFCCDADEFLIINNNNNLKDILKEFNSNTC